GADRPSTNGAPATSITTPAAAPVAPAPSSSAPSSSAPSSTAPSTTSTPVPTAPVPVGADGEPLADWEIALLEQGDSAADDGESSASGATTTSTTDGAEQPGRNDDKSNGRDRTGGTGDGGQNGNRTR